MKMKNEIVEYKIDSFVDYKGLEHKIVLCALSFTPESNEFDDVFSVGWKDVDGYTVDYAAVKRVLSIGVSVCNPEDKFDEETGKKYAYNKAKHDSKSQKLFTSSKGVINKTLVNAFLEQEMNFIKENPEKVIKGYNDSKARYEKKNNLLKEYNALTEEERSIVSMAMEGNLDKYVNIAGKLKNYDQKC